MIELLPKITRDGTASLLHLEGGGALLEGDTERARLAHQRSGELVMKSLSEFTAAEERDYVRFLAATQYYLAGLYREAWEIARHIKSAHLPPRYQELFGPFWADVMERSAPDYLAKMTAVLEQQVAEKRYQEVVDTLKAHQFLVPRERMAYLRGWACAGKGDHEGATLFFEDAWKFAPTNETYLTNYLDSLRHERRTAEAQAIWEEHQRDANRSLAKVGA